LEAVKDVWDHWMGDEVLVASDKEINEAREGVEFKFIQTAYMPLPSKMKLPKDVEKFLDDGKPPVFIGFGSNPIARPEEYFTMFSHVLEATNQRLIISKGWADLPETKEKDILYVEEMPYEYLFPRLAAVIHHGGTGTMAVAARAGIPQAAFPFMADQFENRKQITRLGIGPDTTDFKKMTAEDITNAIRACVTDVRFKENAVSLAEKLKGVNGVDMTVKVVESVAL
jgi:sterol 3beta-glucosyltransferase